MTSKTGTRYKVHKLALAVAVAMAATGKAQALGLGDIELQSALNEPLKAEIRLVSPQPGELESAIVKLAPNEAFELAGVDRIAALSDLEFTVMRRFDGVPIIKVTSSQPVREPFLDFIVQLRWPAGRLMREYTVLLDPPVMDDQAPPPMQAPVATVRSAPAPVAAAPASSAPRGGEARTQPQSAPAAAFTPGSYGPTQRNDTLWNIAEALRPDEGVSVHQMMLALLRANPNAFYDDNVNNLKAGYVLRVPERELITALSRSEALQESQRQYQRWLRAKEGLVDTPPQTGISPAAGPDASAAASASGDDGSRLRLVSPGDESGAGIGESGDVNQIRGELAMALEAADAAQAENEELRSRLGALENQIDTLQRMLALQNETLGQVQDQTAGVTPPATDATTSPVKEPPVVPLPSLDTAPAPAPQVVSPTPPPAGPQSLLNNPSMIAAAGGVGLLLLTLLWMMVRRRRSAAEDEELVPAGGFVRQEADDVAPAVAAASVATATAAAAAAPAAEDELRHDEGMDQVAEEVAQDAAGHVSETADDLNMLEGAEGDVDPLVEADVYLAYRRFDQAEELVKKALESDPNQPELRAKLLEVYYAAKNGDAFQSAAEGFYTSLGENAQDPLWLRVVAMGQELCPTHHLFAEGEAVSSASETGDTQLFDGMGEFATTAAAAGGEVGQAGDSFNFDMVEQSGGSGQTEEALDLDLNLGGESAEMAPADSTALADELDFGLGSSDDALGQYAEAASAAARTDSAKEESWDVEPAMSDFGAMDFGLDDTDLLAGTDVVGTKLDLAKAYIDMGDQESAREILKEIEDEGNDEQKKEAQALSERID